jgi:hypothetical protein
MECSTGITLNIFMVMVLRQVLILNLQFAAYIAEIPGSTATATFGTNEIYIPNYTSSNYKSISIDLRYRK